MLKAIQVYQFYHPCQALNKFQIAEFLLRQAENSAELRLKVFFVLSKRAHAYIYTITNYLPYTLNTPDT